MSASAPVIHAAITGWGKCLPPAVLSNHDLSGMLDTSDEWIVSRTGIRERRISHVGLEELAYVAAARALAAAGLAGERIELIVFGTCSHDDQVPNMASGIQVRIGAQTAAAFDINTACTSFLYGLSAASALIRTGVVHNALVIGAELISPFMDWTDRDVAVLFGDGAAAVVLEGCEREEGVLAEKLGCYGEARETLRVLGMGGRYANRGVLYGVTRWQFEGQEIFRRAVQGMASACEATLARLQLTAADVDLVVPHQANLRIIEAVARRAHAADGARVRQHRALRKYVGRYRAGRAVRSARAGAGAPRGAAVTARLRGRPELLRAPGALGRTHDAAAVEQRGLAAERAQRARAGARLPRAQAPARRRPRRRRSRQRNCGHSARAAGAALRLRG